MKKFLSVFLAAVFVCTAFFGCSKSQEAGTTPVESEQAEPQTLEIIVYDRGGDEAYWNAVIAAFQAENAGVTVDAFISADAAYELRDRVLAGNSPDFVFLPSDEESGVTAALVKDKAMTPISDVAQTASTLMLSGATDNSVCKPYPEDGAVFMLPLFFESKGLIYNKQLLSSNGWSVPKTWDEMIALAETSSDKKIYAFSYAGASPDEFTDIFTAAIEPAVGAETMKSLLDCKEDAWSNENIKIFAEKLDAIKSLVAPKSSTKSRGNVVDELKEGTVLFISGTESELEELNADEAGKYGFAAYPMLSGENSVSLADFSEMYIPIEAKNAELAKKFMIFLYGDTAAGAAAENLGELPPIQKAAQLAGQYELDALKEEIYPSIGTNAFHAEFASKASDNASLSDEFCELCVSVFKSDVTPDEFSEKMLEYIKEY